MTNIINSLKGYKTYFVGVIGAVIALLQTFSIISLNTNQLIAVAFLIAALFGITFRDALNSMTAPVTNTTITTSVDTTNKPTV